MNSQLDVIKAQAFVQKILESVEHPSSKHFPQACDFILKRRDGQFVAFEIVPLAGPTLRMTLSKKK